MTFRELTIGSALRAIRHVAPSDRFLWPAARIALAKRDGRGTESLLPTADGFQMRLRLGQYPDGAMYFGVFEVQTIRLIKSILKPGDRAVDVGANIGYMTLHMAKRVGATGEVHSFEPVPGNRARLEQALVDNHFGFVRVHSEALGEKSDKTLIYDFSASTAGHAESSLRPLHENATALPCDVVRMDDVIDGPVRLIKVDVEGAEVGVLRGATRVIRENKPHLIVENNPKTLQAFGVTFADVYEAIRSAHDGYDAILLTAFSPKLSVQDLKADTLPAANVWFRPRV